MSYTKTNENFWNTQSENADYFTVPISTEEYKKVHLSKEPVVCLTSVKKVPLNWFPKLDGLKILGLASGGGQQGPVFAACGADVTIMDLSDRQLESERMVAAREGYKINIVKADMTEPFPFESNTFDLIFHPVSNCYIDDIQHVWDECGRVIKKGGLLLSGFCKEEIFMFEFDWDRSPAIVVKHPLPFNPLKVFTPAELDEKAINTESLVFSHSLEEQIGGQIKAGFNIIDIYEDKDDGGVFARYMNSYVATCAVKQ